jgi:hypothetical protein
MRSSKVPYVLNEHKWVLMPSDIVCSFPIKWSRSTKVEITDSASELSTCQVQRKEKED